MLVSLPTHLPVCLSVFNLYHYYYNYYYLFIYLPNPLTNLRKMEGYNRKWNIFMKVSFPIITSWNDLAFFHKITNSSSSNM